MTPNEQEAKSSRALASPFLIIPHAGGTFSLLTGHGTQAYLGTFTPADLLTYFRTSFAEGRAAHSARKEEEAALAALDSSLLADLGL